MADITSNRRRRQASNPTVPLLLLQASTISSRLRTNTTLRLRSPMAPLPPRKNTISNRLKAFHRSRRFSPTMRHTERLLRGKATHTSMEATRSLLRSSTRQRHPRWAMVPHRSSTGMLRLMLTVFARR